MLVASHSVKDEWSNLLSLMLFSNNIHTSDFNFKFQFNQSNRFDV